VPTGKSSPPGSGRWVAMAKRHCRTSDRHAAPRMPGPDRCVLRGAFAPCALCLCGLLQSIASASIFAEGCAVTTSHPTSRQHRRHPDPWWITSPIRPDIIFGKDRHGILVGKFICAASIKHRQRCAYRTELDLQTLVCTRGRDFPLARIAERLRCPRCGCRRVSVVFGPPTTSDVKAAAVPALGYRWRLHDGHGEK
jgi:hypothetical protein